MNKIRPYRPAIVLAAGCLLVASMRGQRQVSLEAPLTGVLPSLAGYHVQDQLISEDERRVAGMSDYVARVYSRDSLVAFTTLVSYYSRQARGTSVHSAKNCLPGAGWEVLSGGTEAVTVNGTRQVVNRYLLKRGSSRAVVYYWYQGRGRVVASEYMVKWNLLRDAALRGHTEEALVRVVVPLHPAAIETSNQSESDVAQASALGKAVAGRIIRDLDRALPRGG